MDFYDQLAPLYHLIYPDWPASVALQGTQLDAVVQAEWPGAKRVLDLSCGIGTQALGLAQRGYAVTASDVSSGAVARAQREAAAMGVALTASVGDMRDAHALHGSGFDVVLSADNAVPHLLSDADILAALRQTWLCLRPGGGCVLTVRDYAQEPRGRHLVKHYGARVEGRRRHVLFQVWDFDGAEATHYDFSFFAVEENLDTQEVSTRVMRSRYYAITTDHLLALLAEAGFVHTRRLDGAFYQPVLVGTRPRA
ncbi:MAG: class I SAM-dependent methyltransferase [Proteobacteria bacterium]|nr:class I SAM-dependent methyltransferase [Pseudomonadota bacterium]